MGGGDFIGGWIKNSQSSMAGVGWLGIDERLPQITSGLGWGLWRVMVG